MTNPSPSLFDILGKALTSEMKSIFDDTMRSAVADSIDVLVEVIEPLLDDEQAAQVRDAATRLFGETTSEPEVPDVTRVLDERLLDALRRSVTLDAELALREDQAAAAKAKREQAAKVYEDNQHRLAHLRGVATNIADAVVDESADARPLAAKAFAEYIDGAEVSFDDHPRANVFIAVRDGLMSVDEAVEVVTERNDRTGRAIVEATERAATEERSYSDYIDVTARVRGAVALIAEALARPILVSDDYVMRADEYQPRLTVALRNASQW